MRGNSAITAQTSPEQPNSSRNGMTAAVLSAIGMGLGQMYNRQFMKGAILLVVYVLALFFFIGNLGHAMWGLFTLGDVAQHLEKVGKINKMVPGDNSIYLLVEGLITLFVFILFLIIYVSNIRDAFRVARVREEGGHVNTFTQTMAYIVDKKFPFLILALPLTFVFFFTILPQSFNILLAFTNYSSPNHIPPKSLVDWVGLGSFTDLFTLKAWAHTFYGVFTWTVIWTVFATLTTFFGGFAVALLVQQEGIRFKTMWRTIFMLPFAIPMFVSTLIMRNMFNARFGPINQYLKAMGIEGPPWLSDPTWAKATVIMVNTWLGYPVSMLLVIGILTTIPKDMYEAAEVDGATAWQKFKMITFPSVMFALAPILIGQFAGNFNNFGVIYLLTNGNPANSEYQFAGHTDILITWLYNLSISNGKYNFASVVSIIIFCIIAPFSVYQFRRTKMIREEDTYR